MPPESNENLPSTTNGITRINLGGAECPLRDAVIDTIQSMVNSRGQLRRNYLRVIGFTEPDGTMHRYFLWDTEGAELADLADQDATSSGLDDTDWYAVLRAAERISHHGRVVVQEYPIKQLRLLIRDRINARAYAAAAGNTDAGRWTGLGPSLIGTRLGA